MNRTRRRKAKARRTRRKRIARRGWVTWTPEMSRELEERIRAIIATSLVGRPTATGTWLDSLLRGVAPPR